MRRYNSLILFFLLLFLIIGLSLRTARPVKVSSVNSLINNTSVFPLSKTEKIMTKSVNDAKNNKIPMVLNYPLIGKSTFVGFDSNGTPRYYAGHNERAAIGSGTNLLWDSSIYNLNGEGLTVGVWDAGAVRSTHEEFTKVGGGSRVDNKMSPLGELSTHSTHVTGVIIAEGKNNSIDNPASPSWFLHRSTHGMANKAQSENYTFQDDSVTMPANVGAYLVTNHSYGALSGWGKSEDGDGNPIYLWYGGAGNVEDSTFGSYGSRSAMFDQVASDQPNSLMVASAGNDRNDNFHDDIEKLVEPQYYLYGHLDSPIPFDRVTAPKEDGKYMDGYGTIDNPATAKNIITVGAINDMVDANNERLDFTTKLDPITKFSAWGPCDDGRLKPDLVAMGGYLYSPVATSDTACDAYYGTSQAAPVVSGSALLLQEFYKQQVGHYMLADSLKALLLHTAYDLGRIGPDYSYGWGYLDAEQAIHTIEESMLAGSFSCIQELTLINGNTNELQLIADGNQSIVATLVWTDPAHAIISGDNDPTPALINDLDLKVRSSNQLFKPWVLDHTNPEALATQGDNVVDNIEQVLISTPTAEQTYTLSVNHKGTLVNDQNYSLVISGIKNFYLTHGSQYIADNDLESQSVFGQGSTSVVYDLKVVNMTSKPTSLSGLIMSDTLNFSSTVSPGVIIPARATFNLPVTYHPSNSFENTCDVRLTFDNGKYFELKLYGQVDQMVIPTSDETVLVDFPSLILGSEWTKTLSLKNGSIEEITIDSTTPTTTGQFSLATASTPISSGEFHVLQISYHPTEEGVHEDQSVLTFSNGVSLTLNLKGTARLFDIDHEDDSDQPPLAPPTNSGNDDLDFDASNKITYTIHPGWNLISIPFSDVNQAIHTFENNGYPMWKWDPTIQCYVKLNDLAYLEGIWVYNHNSEAKVFDFVGIVPKAPEVNILPGWGLYGTSTITQTSGFPSYINSVFEWSLGLYLKLEASQISPTKGYWFFNQNSTEEKLQL